MGKYSLTYQSIKKDNRFYKIIYPNLKTYEEVFKAFIQDGQQPEHISCVELNGEFCTKQVVEDYKKYLKE